MQNLPEKDLDEFKGTVRSLMEDLQTPAEVKASILGLGLMNLVGEDVLRAAVENIRHYIVSGPTTYNDSPSAFKGPASARTEAGRRLGPTSSARIIDTKSR